VFSVTFRVYGLGQLGLRGFRDYGLRQLEFRVQSSGFRVWGLVFMATRAQGVKCLGFRVQGLEFRV
jgi:hypothetical protein